MGQGSKRRRIVFETSGVIDAPPDVVIRLVADGRVATDPQGTPLKVEFDADRRTLAVQGGWWYRGEYRTEPEGTGSRLFHRVVDVAPQPHWVVALANRGFIGFASDAERRFQELLASIRRDLPTP